MNKHTHLPEKLEKVLDSEKRDFVVKSSREQPIRLALGQMFFGMVWMGGVTFFLWIFLGPFVQGLDEDFTWDPEILLSRMDNNEVAVPVIVLGVFSLIGIGVFLGGFLLLFQRGGYYVGTAKRLLYYKNGRVRAMDWEQFTGNMEISGTDARGSLSLEMRTGRIVSQKGAVSEKFIPDVVYMHAIPDVYNIEKICRRRIRENDPTPSNLKV
jgi:hypothetical protein